MNPSEAGKLGYAKTKAQLEQFQLEKSQRIRDEYEANPKHCPYCGEKIAFERRHAKFCDNSCSASYNNYGKNRHTPGIKHADTSYCSCGKPKLRHNKYCPDCIQNRVYNKYASLDEAPDDRVRKRILIDERGYHCEVCDFSEWRGKPIPLELDHIDGNADNNTADNLRLICPNCHAQTETYKGANAGKNSSRQIMRRKRYAEGKTY